MAAPHRTPDPDGAVPAVRPRVVRGAAPVLDWRAALRWLRTADTAAASLARVALYALVFGALCAIAYAAVAHAWRGYADPPPVETGL